MGYANQLIGGGDGRDRARALAKAGVAGVIVADLTPDEGAPFEAVAAEAGIAVVYLVAPTTAPARRAAVAARSGGFLYCVSLVGVTGARTSLPPTVAKLVREVKAVSPVPVAVGFGVSTAGPRARDRQGGRGRRHRGVGAGRRAGPGRARRGGAGRPRREAPGGDRALSGVVSRPRGRTAVPAEAGRLERAVGVAGVRDRRRAGAAAPASIRSRWLSYRIASTIAENAAKLVSIAARDHAGQDRYREQQQGDQEVRDDQQQRDPEDRQPPAQHPENRPARERP